MGEKLDQAKGRVEEAAGSLTGNEDLKHKGRTDRVGGQVKEKVGDVADKVEDAIDTAKEATRKK